ncbi:RNA polymerase beta subunit [Pseudomonas phage 9Ps-7B]|nr:RNA polymerase beta subunit [Pseudomonas phage Koomba boorn-mokiny kep-wari Wadjak 2]WAX23600.1 hypothetical protein [Pseudomonas phage pPA-N1803-4At.2]WRQ05812.1 RNA polymerase beta subunit [Pseudomonas phage 6B]WRQ06309.1 RNA polymerase beta subunit [Pseudomonas phage 9-Ps-8B]WRQ06717.1 RNA polymerase beta subunit [Pseudomonas phage 9Ps-7B]WRQ07068.1 RNA polymerase beta subunit [Pseudomonas phage 14Ps5-6]BBI55858.1 phage protein [Pseudomonas phage PA02]BDR25335.1 hypothetical protein RV
MGLYAKVVDHNEVHDQFTGKRIYANDYNTSNSDEKEEFDRHFYSHFQDSEAIESSVSCDCRAIEDAHKLGVICDICNTPVVNTSSRPIEPSMWVRTPKHVRSLINPRLIIMLTGYLVTKEFDFLAYLTDTSYRYDVESIGSKETRRKVDRLLHRGFERGLNHFIDNFNEIFQFLLDANIISNNKSEFAQFVAQNKDKLFPKYLPVPSKLCFVAESTTSGTYLDKPIEAAIDATLTFASIDASSVPLSPIKAQNRTMRGLRLYGQFYEIYAKSRIAQKPGLARRHMFGARLNATARAVITSISDPHDYDELHIPWGVGCQLLKYHLTNKLKAKFNMTTREAFSFVYENVLQYNQIIADLFKELIAEAAPYKGMGCTFHRNPTLQRGSTQQFFITKVKDDINDNSISMSVLCLKAPNGQLNNQIR